MGVLQVQHGRSVFSETQRPLKGGTDSGGAPFFGRQPCRSFEGPNVRSQGTEWLLAGQRGALDGVSRRSSGAALL